MVLLSLGCSSIASVFAAKGNRESAGSYVAAHKQKKKAFQEPNSSPKQERKAMKKKKIVKVPGLDYGSLYFFSFLYFIFDWISWTETNLGKNCLEFV